MKNLWITVFLTAVEVFTLKGVFAIELSREKIEGIKESVEMMKKSINETINPCDDYMEYICNDFENISLFTSSENVSLGLYEEKIIKELLQKYLPRQRLASEMKMMKFLESCQNRATHHSEKTLKNYNFPESLEGWPVFNSNWKMDKIDLAALLGELTTIRLMLGVNVEFKQDFNKRTIFISANKIREPSTENLLIKKEELQKLNFEKIDEVLQDVELFERQFSNAVHFQESHEPSEIKTNFHGLKANIPDFEWDKYFQIAAGTIPDDSYPVVIQNLEDVKSAISALNAMQPRTVGNYIFYLFMDRIHFWKFFIFDNCYDLVFFNFQPIITRLLVKNFYTEEYENNFFGVMNSLIETLSEYPGILENSTEDVMKKLKDTLNNKVLPNLSDEKVNKYHENVKIDSNDYWGNLFRIYRELNKEYLANFVKEKKTKLEEDEDFLSYVIVRSIYEFDKKPAALFFESIAIPVITDAVKLFKNPEIVKKLNDTLPKCRREQLEIFNADFYNPQRILIHGSQLFMDAYNKWAKQHEEMVHREDEVFNEYNLSSKKVLFLQMKEMCRYTYFKDGRKRKRILDQLKTLEDFVKEYNCPGESSENTIKEC